jgi:hypothetical protein
MPGSRARLRNSLIPRWSTFEAARTAQVSCLLKSATDSPSRTGTAISSGTKCICRSKKPSAFEKVPREIVR